MDLITWNVFRHNRTLDLALDHIATQGADIVCLQEVPADMLHATLKLAPYATWCYEYASAKKGIDTRLVILSQHPFHYQRVQLHGQYPSLKTRLNRCVESMEYQSVDLTVNGHDYRVFNIHMPLNTTPRHRLAELEDILAHKLHPTATNLLCGDFNSCGRPLISGLWGWMQSYKLRDWLMHEKRALEKLTTRYGYDNPFRRWRTHSQLPFQLDAILIPEDLPIQRMERIKARVGSDHFPLRLVVDPAMALAKAS